LDRVGTGLGAEPAGRGERIGDGGDGDAGDETGTDEGDKAAAGRECSLNHVIKV
jgi:hypothetical protein